MAGGGNKRSRLSLGSLCLIDKVNACYDVLRNSGFGEIHKIDVAAPRSGNAECVGIYLTLTLPKKSDVFALEKKLCEIDGVRYAVEI